MRPHALPLVVLFLLASCATAHAYVTPGPLFEASGYAYAGGMTGWRDARLADMNGDGRADLVTGTQDNGVAVALSTNSMSFARFTHSFEHLGGVSIEVGDFDGDGLMDVGGVASGIILIGYGDGLGGWSQTLEINGLTGYGPAPSVCPAKLDANGTTDLIVHSSDTTLTVYRGNADRTLTELGTYTFPGTIEYFDAGDVTGGAAADLVVSFTDLLSVAVLPGLGDGSFGAQIDVAVPTEPLAIAIGDLVPGGPNELVLRFSHDVSYASDTGAGVFGPFTAITPAEGGIELFLEDFDHDGGLDVGTFSVVSGKRGVESWLADGKGGFTPRIDSRACIYPAFAAALGDIDGDGNLDLAASIHFQNAPAIVSRGHGDGTFGDPLVAPAPVSGWLRSMAGDFDRDGKIDGLGYNQDTKKLAFARGRGDGTFDPIVESAALPLQYGLMVSGEFDAIAGLDLVGLSSLTSVVSFLHGNGDGTFSAPVDLAVPHSGKATVADVDGNGKLDVAIPQKTTNMIAVMFQGPAGLAAPVTTTSATGPNTVAYADFTGDGLIDRVVSCTGQLVFDANDGAGGYTTVRTIALSKVPTALAFADLDEDGRLDLVFNEEFGTSGPPATLLHMLAGIPGGFAATASNIDFDWDPEGSTPYWGRSLSTIRCVDLDEDGHLDIVGKDPSYIQINSARGHGDGTFEVAESAVNRWMGDGVDLGDFNGDGHIDVLTSGREGSTVRFSSFSVFLNRTGGVVGVPAPAPVVSGIALAAPFPNPARASFTLRFRVPERSAVSVDLVSVTGRRVLSRTTTPEAPGEQSLHIDGLDHLAPGVYGVVVSQGDRRATTRLVVLP